MFGLFSNFGFQEYILLGLFFCVFFLLCLVPAIVRSKKEKQLLGYWDVEIGMPEDEMLSIMGANYSRSLLKNNRTKYEWRIESKSYGSSYKGISSRTYYGVKKVSIYVKDGYVEEVKTLNM